eukprot:11298027-Alexandrium_andersonii.AAC.1
MPLPWATLWPWLLSALVPCTNPRSRFGALKKRRFGTSPGVHQTLTPSVFLNPLVWKSPCKLVGQMLFGPGAGRAPA